MIVQTVKIKSPDEVRDHVAEYSMSVPNKEFGEQLITFAEALDGKAYSEHVAIYIWKLCAKYPFGVFYHNLDIATRILVSGLGAIRTIENEMGELRRTQRVLLREELTKSVTQAFPLF